METMKILGEVRAIPEKENDRKVVFVASTSTRDRHRTVLNQAGWKLDNFNRNPVTGYQHNVYGDICNPPNPDDVLGPAKAWVDGTGEQRQLMIEIDFETADLNPLADKIFRKIKNGTLRSVSVGFMELGAGKYGEKDNGEQRGGDNETYYFEGQELLEVSVVNIPSNPDAVIKQLRSNTKDALMYLVKAFGEKYTLSEIDNMKVSEIRELLSHRKAIGPRVKIDGHEKWYNGEFELDGFNNIGEYSDNRVQELKDEKEEEEKDKYLEFLERLDDIGQSVAFDKIKNK